MTDSTEAFQIPLEAAEAYEATFVPALFADWALPLVAASGFTAGQRLLDVACGTGIVARTAADRAGRPDGIVGVDLNEAMLTVARRVRPEIEWRQGDVARLPFADGEFDAVVCQFALMFFPDRAGAVAEMRRVARSGGVVALSVPAALADQPTYGAVVDVATRCAGRDAAALLDTYWSCGDLDMLHGLFAQAGLVALPSQTLTTTAHYPSVDAFVAAEVESTPLAERVSASVVDGIRTELYDALARYVTPSGSLDVPLVGHIVSGSVPG